MAAQVRQVCTGAAYCFHSPIGKRNSFQWHVFRMYFKDFLPAIDIRIRDVNSAVKPACTKKGGINGFEKICRTNDQNLPSVFKSIQLNKKFCQYSLFKFTTTVLTVSGNSVDFIDINDRRSFALRFSKLLTKCFF